MACAQAIPNPPVYISAPLGGSGTFIAATRHGNSFRQIADPDRSGGRRDAIDRAKRAAADPISSGHGDQQQHRSGDEQCVSEPMQQQQIAGLRRRSREHNSYGVDVRRTFDDPVGLSSSVDVNESSFSEVLR